MKWCRVLFDSVCFVTISTYYQMCTDFRCRIQKLRKCGNMQCIDKVFMQPSGRESAQSILNHSVLIARARLFGFTKVYMLHLVVTYTHTHNTHTHTTVLQPFLRDHSGEPVPEENFWTLWCKGRLTEADTLTILLGATPSGLTSASTIPLPYSLQAGCPSCHPTNSIKALKATSTFGLGGRRR